jgi:hypothetical protein
LCESHIVTQFHFLGVRFLLAMVAGAFIVAMPQLQLIT